MAEDFGKSKSTKKEDKNLEEIAYSILQVSREAMLILDENFNFIAANTVFYDSLDFRSEDSLVLELNNPDGAFKTLKDNLLTISLNRPITDVEFSINQYNSGKRTFLVNASKMLSSEWLIISFSKKTDQLDNFDAIFSQAPAVVCLLKGPDHTFDRANENYYKIIGHRDIIGKTVREALPELEGQGFYEMLDNVYKSGKAFIGSEISVKLDAGKEGLKNSIMDFVYQPLVDPAGKVTGIFVHAIDITEKVEARKKLEKSEAELRKLIDAVPAIIWITKSDGQNYYLNRKWYEFTGQSEVEALDFGWFDAVHPEDRERVKSDFLKANHNRKHFHTSFRLLSKTGEYIWVLDSGSPKFNVDGEYEGMIGIVIDIDEAKTKEQIIKEKEHRIRTIIEEADVATALYTGKEMRIEMANDAMIELWGKEKSVIGTTLHEALPELEGQPFHDLLQGVYATGETYWGKEDPVDLVIDNELKTGYFNFTYKALRNEKGEIYGILNMALDVSEMVKSKELLRESEARYKQMADLMPEKVANIDPDGKVIYFNQGWLEYTGLSKEEFEKQGLENLIHPSEQEDFQRSWEYSLKTGRDFEMELRYLNKKGKYKWHLNRTEAIKEENGNIQLWISTATEIQKIKAEEKRKEDFLKLVSHELKTPVTSIKGYVQLLLSMLKKEKEIPLTSIPFEKSLERIDQQVVRLTRLISEMLDLSRIEKNKLNLKKEIFSLNDLISETIQDINYTNTHSNIKITEKYNCHVYADKDRIGQVLINLVTNAIKYSPQNSDVEIKIKKAGESKVAVSVIDSGIGIDKENQKDIFKRFYRIDFKNDETYSGFGIGLYLANEIMRRHQGKLSVDSEKGKGSVFTFIMDVAASHNS
ncbi:PAS domain-containing sensor histidine kinase [Gramella lutea]|uniref:histidine kinase n=1 Tax=Christiangramia lutea TaxID=1607951 RepID=A0A9X2AA19_9FLAO|nr:PAS domain S-box protein [Christiangramia lutea]MCH4822252.1 PAS domain-containing sensor histidine kinase [Christiangramia lutea]